jgi:hypothetical protein
MKNLLAWPVDSLIKVFPDDRPPRRTARGLAVLAARGATESAQFAFRTGRDSRTLEIRIEPPRLSGKGGAVLTDIRWRRVEFVPVRRSAWYLHPSQRLRPGPAFYPDPLIEPETFDVFYKKPAGGTAFWPLVMAETANPVWLTIRVPADAVPGMYRGSIRVKTEAGSAVLPLAVEVSPAVLPAARTLKLTHWFSAANIAEAASAASWSEAHWAALALWARNLAEHRANVVISPLTELLELSRDAAGRLTVDFTRFDRWVELFRDAGVIGFIEGGHLAGRIGDWTSPFGLNEFTVRLPDGTRESFKGEPVESPRARQFLADLLRPLTAHLKDKGWLSLYYQHLADEPIKANADSYRVLAELAKAFAPELVRFDATMADETLAGTVTAWCPQSQEAEKELAFFRTRQAAGEEVWHYTCLAPDGAYPNRFLAQPLLGTRVLHWFNFTAGLTGYLHWGFNYWQGFRVPATAFCNTDSTDPAGQQRLPGGDTHVVYPGGPGGAPRDSIRHEMVLEGVQDYELLRISAAAYPRETLRLARSVVPRLTRYERSAPRFRAARRKLLDLVAAVQNR